HPAVARSGVGALRCTSFTRSSCRACRTRRQPYGKHRALAWCALHRHVAAHHTRGLARDGKAEPRSTVALRGRGVRLREFLEQLGLLLRRHPDTGVADGEFDPIAPVSDLAYP